MSTYDWPTTRGFMPAMAELRVVDNTQRILESPLSGYVQTLAMPGARWGWGMDFAAQAQAERQALEAYLLKLSGRQHRVRLWDLKRPRPLGSILASGVTLASAAAQFATSLQLAGCRAANNLLLGGGFAIDTNADGLSDGLASFTAGSVSGIGFSRPAGTQRVAVSTLGSTSSDRAGVSFAAPAAVTAGAVYTAAADMVSNGGTQHAIEVACYTAGDVFISSAGYATWAGTGSFARRSVTFTAPAGAAKAYVYLYMHSASIGGPELQVASAQLEPGSAATTFTGPATLLGGDWLGLATGQLVRVVADAQANDAGVMTVDVRHMLRTAASSGSAVVLEKPTALFVRTEAGLAMPRQPGLVEPGMSIELVEAFA